MGKHDNDINDIVYFWKAQLGVGTVGMLTNSAVWRRCLLMCRDLFVCYKICYIERGPNERVILAAINGEWSQ